MLVEVLFRDITPGELFWYQDVQYRRVFENEDAFFGTYNAREVNNTANIAFFHSLTIVKKDR